MSSFRIISHGTVTTINLAGPAIKSGGEGDIFRVAEYSGCLAKIYHGRNSSSRFDRSKIEAMIARPPEKMSSLFNGTTLPLFAWPTHIIEDSHGNGVGFLMPEIPTDRAVTLSKYMSRQMAERYLSEDDRSLPRRFQLCRNLAAAIAELHRQNHFFVDLKPDNIFMFKDTGIICLIDNDGFSIDAENNKRYPAKTYTSQYLAPELLKNGSLPSSVVNDWQDRFALAALMFQILNNGLHPFQGVPLIDSDEWNIDFCVRNGYYPHGIHPNAAIRPTESSVHDCWEQPTRALFDRAFASAQPDKRPTSTEWREHLDTFLHSKSKFIRCTNKPRMVTHIHIAGTECPECRVPDIPLPLPLPPSGNGLPPPDPSNRKWLYLIFAIAILVVISVSITNA